MVRECRHILSSGKKCEANSLKGTPFCYFHTTTRRFAQDRPGPPGPLEIPVLEDHQGIQLVLAQVLNALMNKTLDARRAAIVLRGLQLATQNVKASGNGFIWSAIKDLIQHSEAGELAPENDEDEGDEEEE